MARFILSVCLCTLPVCYPKRIELGMESSLELMVTNYSEAEPLSNRTSALQLAGKTNSSESNSSNDTNPPSATATRLSVGLEEPEVGVALSGHNETTWHATEGAFTDMYCPGSGSATHASAKVITSAEASCEDVLAEIKNRANYKGDWHDPSNMYSNEVPTYSYLQDKKNGSLKIEIGRTTPRFQFHDLINLELLKLGSNGDNCLIKGCSRSQGYSVGDFHTNYCNIWNLICGFELGCIPVGHNFRTTEITAFSSCGMRDYQQCLKYVDTTEPDPEPSKIQEYKAWAGEIWGNCYEMVCDGAYAVYETLWKKMPDMGAFYGLA